MARAGEGVPEGRAEGESTAPRLEDLPDATLRSLLARWKWRRANPEKRKELRKHAERWLERNAPVVVRIPTGQIVLNGPAECSRSIFLTGSYELEEEARFAALLKPGMTVFDVGANLGIYTLLASRVVGRSGAVHSFEPVPQMFGYLSEAARRTGLRNAVLNPVAVSEQEGAVTMYLADERKRSGWHALAPSPERSGRVDVRAVTLDGYAREKGIRRVHVLKIDIEGAELLAFRGAPGLLSGPEAPIIQSEMCDEHTAHFGYTCADAKAHLAEHGYGCYRCRPGGAWEVVETQSAHPRYENVLFLKPEHRPLLPSGWRVPQP